MPRGFLPAVAALLALTVAVGTQQPTSVTEPATGIAFPVSLVPPGGDAAHHLMGTAVRTRTIFRVKIYALGLYVDPQPARQTLAPFAGARRADLERDGRFYDALLQLRFAMTLRLVMARDVGGRDVADAFDDALRPRVRAAASTGAMPGGEAALERFRAFFNLDEVARGTEIVFSCAPDGRLETMVDRSPKPAIESPALCRALFDVYLGEKPISDDARRNLVAGFEGLLAVRALRAPGRGEAPYRAADTATSARARDAGGRSARGCPASSCSES